MFFLKKGFTLIELLVVIAIIALLASIVIMSVREAAVNSRDSRRIADIKEIRNALEHYANAHDGGFPSHNCSRENVAIATTSTSDSDCTPSPTGPTLQDELRLYLDPIPNDPLYKDTNSDWWVYKYHSDIYNYELVVHFEKKYNECIITSGGVGGGSGTCDI